MGMYQTGTGVPLSVPHEKTRSVAAETTIRPVFPAERNHADVSRRTSTTTKASPRNNHRSHRHRRRFLRGYKRLASRCCFRTYIHTYMSYIYLFVQVHFTRTRSIPIHMGTRTLKNDSIDNQ